MHDKLLLDNLILEICAPVKVLSLSLMEHLALRRGKALFLVDEDQLLGYLGVRYLRILQDLGLNSFKCLPLVIYSCPSRQRSC